MLFLVAGLLAIGAQPAAASPGAFKVLFAKAEDGGCEGDTGLQDQLRAMPQVTKVDVFDASSGTPSVAQLDPYDMVVTMSDCDAYADQDAIGNNLADYADHGGVVVQYSFSIQNNGHYTLAGRWLSGGYAPYVPGANSDTDVTLGEHDTASPLMAGVNSLVSLACNNNPTLAPGATRVAQWNTGLEAIAFKGQAVAVNAGIEDTSCGWGGDFAQLTLNAAKMLDKHPPSGTAISKAKINRKKHTAKLLFGAPGTVTGFECSLTRPKKKKGKKSAAFSACGSPKLYKKLRKGKYTFQVRALNANGPDAAPAIKKFKI